MNSWDATQIAIASGITGAAAATILIILGCMVRRWIAWWRNRDVIFVRRHTPNGI